MKLTGLRKLMERLRRRPLPLPYMTPPVVGAVRFVADVRTAAQLLKEPGR